MGLAGDVIWAGGCSVTCVAGFVSIECDSEGGWGSNSGGLGIFKQQ